MTAQAPSSTFLQQSYSTIAASTGLVFITLCLLPPIALAFESSMVAHMLIQLPLLGISGAMLLVSDSKLFNAADKYDPHGAIALVVGSGWLLYWMLPMNLDFASTDASYRILKLISVPLGIGLCFRWVWIRANTIVRIVVLFEAWAGVARLGLLYLESPEQLCSNYLIGEQQVVGKVLLAVALLTGLGGLILGVFGNFYSAKKAIVGSK